MDDCADLEKILAVAQKTLTEMEVQAAIYTESTIPAPLKIQRNEKREEVEDLKARLKTAQLEKEKVQQAAQVGMNRQSPMRSRVPSEHYIERDEAKRLLDRFAITLQQPKELLFNICGIGGVGKTTLLGRLREAHADNVDFLEVCFAKTADIETPLKLMRKVHQQARELLGTETSTDAFTQREQLFENTLFELSHRSVDGKETSSEDARKITSWFERFIWLGTASFASTPNHPKSYGAEFAPSGAIGEDAEGLKEWIQQRVRNHPATKDQPELQALMLEPVSQLTQAFAESLMQVAQHRARSLVLILDTYEKAQAYLNQWLWQYLVEDTPLASSPVRLVVVGRRSLQADEGWRKLNQDRTLLHVTQLQRFSKNDTEAYLKQIGIQNGGTRAKIYKATQGLPYYLDWVRKQREDGKEPDFSKGNQAIAELLLQGTNSQQRRILQVVACCRWFDLAMIRYLLECNIPGLQQANDTAEDYFEWLKSSDFVEFSKGHYRLDDVARDVFRQSYFQDDQNQFRKINALLADYFKQQMDELVDPQSPLPDPYEDEEWRRLIAEFLYYSLFGKGREGLHQYIEQVLIAAYLREPDVFMAPFAFINSEMSEENRNLLPNATDKFFKNAAIALRFGWFFLDKRPKSYKLQFEGEDDLSEEAIEARLKKIEDSLKVLLEQIGNLPDSFGKCVGLIDKSRRCNRSRDIIDSLLQAKSQAEQLTTHCRPKLLHSLFSKLGSLLNDIDRYQDALDCCEKALELWEGNALTFSSKGIALGNLERHEEALESFQKVIDLDPESVNAWINRGAALTNLERYEEALESFQNAIDLDPKSVAWIHPWDALRALRRHSEALTACDRALEIDPENLNALNSQALTLSFLKDFDKAIEVIDQAIHLSPEEVVFKANRGIVLARGSQYIEALAAYEQAIRQDPEHESGYYAKACSYALQGEIEKAVDNLKKAIEISPHNSRREAKHNPDFDPMRDDERFRALVYLE